MWNAGLDEAQPGIKIARKTINNLRYPDDTTLMAESEEEQRASWWKWKGRVKNLAYNSSFRKLRSWHLVASLHGKYMGKWWKQWQTILESNKITANGDYSQIKRHWLLGRKVMTKVDSILKSRHISLPTKVHLVKVMVFPVVIYGCENWTMKKADHQRIDGF